MPKQTHRAGSRLQPLPICVLQIGIWIEWSWRCPEGGRRRQSPPRPDLRQEQTFKMRINFGAGGGTEEEEPLWNPLPLCAENRQVIKRRRKTGIVLTQTHMHARKALACQCTICNINVWKRARIGAWKAQAFLGGCTSLFFMCRDVPDTTTVFLRLTYTNKQRLAPWIMQVKWFHPTQNTYLVNKLLTPLVTRHLCK